MSVQNSFPRVSVSDDSYMNEWLFTSYGETSLVKKGPVATASTPLDWMVRGPGVVLFFMLNNLPLALSLAWHGLVLAWKILHPIPVSSFFSTPRSSSLTQTGYPVIQVISDTVYLEKHQILQVKGLTLWDCPALSPDCICWLQVHVFSSVLPAPTPWVWLIY